jgi:hypothetical protein
MNTRRNFLKTSALAVALPLLPQVIKSDSLSPQAVKPELWIKPERNDHISTGFPTIDEALGGGLRRGSVNTIFGFDKRACYIGLTMCSKISKRSYCCTSETPIRNLSFLISKIKEYDLVVIDHLDGDDVYSVQRLALEHNCCVVLIQNTRHFAYRDVKWLQMVDQFPFHFMAPCSAVLSVDKNEDILSLVKNRYGKRVDVQFYKNGFISYELCDRSKHRIT